MNKSNLNIAPKEKTLGEMGLMEHLVELRKRLMYVALILLATTVAAYSYSDVLLEIMFLPFFNTFDKGMLIGTGPAEAFILKLKVAGFGGLLLGSPLIFIQLWLFITPGLYENERKMLIPFVITTTLLFVGGAFFCYEYVFPFAFTFFKEQYDSIPKVTAAIKMDELLGMVIKSMLGFGLIFEMPVLAFFLGKLGIIDYKMMLAGSRYAIVIIFILSAVLTPPDVFSQLLMAAPLLVLYALSIVIVKYTGKKFEDV